MGNGLPHGYVIIGNGAVVKAAFLVAAKSINFMLTNSDSCRSLIQENEQLKENNEILIEKNSVNRELVMRLYVHFGKEPPADLLKRLVDIDARCYQVAGFSHADSDSTHAMHNIDISGDMHSDDNDFTDHNHDDDGDENGFNDNNHDDDHGFGHDYEDDDHGFGHDS